MFGKIKSWGIFIVILSALLAACSGGQTPAANNSAAPNTGSSGSAAPIPTLDPGGPAPALVFALNPGKSEASYSIQEQLARNNFPTTAVGKTNTISGQIALRSDGSVDPAYSKFTVDLSSLATDSGMRDNFVRQNILQTGQYPQAVFVPGLATNLPASLPVNGSFDFKLTGNLTLHGVTKPVTWNVSAKMTNGEATGTATTSFTFEDFGLSQPKVPIVLSVVDNITLNITFDMTPAGG